jgi:hypothetical protein
MDAHSTTELKLKLFINNDGRLYELMTKGILRNLVTKKARGQYKHDLAVKAFGYLTEAGAKKYVKDYGTSDQPWHKLFDVAARKRVSEELTKALERAHAGGEYSWLLPFHAHKAATVDGVTVETMPDYLRGSHRAASSWGMYPHNGAVREHVSLEEAEEIVASDPDGYAHIVTTRTKGSSHARKRGAHTTPARRLKLRGAHA